MKLRRSLILISLFTLLLTGMTACFPEDPNQLERIPKEKALAIVAHDADSVYGDLSGYDILVDTSATKWKIDYVAKDSTLREGPRYQVARRGGKIIMKYYPQ